MIFLSIFKKPNVDFKFCRMVKPITTATADGGLFGGVVHIAWYSQKQPSSTKSISAFTQTTCLHLSDNSQPRTGSVSFFLFFVNLSLCVLCISGYVIKIHNLSMEFI